MESEHKSFFVLWNGSEDGLADEARDLWIETTARGDLYPDDWSFGQGFGDPRSGDTVYLLQTGKVKGVIASGTLTSDGTWSGGHWSGSGTAHYVSVDWDVMLDDEQRLPTEVLVEGLPEFKFPVYGSGRRIHEPSASALATMWDEHLADLAEARGNPWLGGRSFGSNRSSGPIPLQRNHVRTYNVGGFASYEAVREEAALVDEFVEQLRADGSDVTGYRMQPTTGSRPLFADAFDKTRNVLYEAKASASREAVRMALGQLLDYRRWFKTEPALAILLPEPPALDLVELMAQHSISCVAKNLDGTFSEVSPTPVSDADALLVACRRLGDPDLWIRPDRYPNSLALTIIDSIQSTGSHYSSVLNVVKRYRSERGDLANTDGTSELLASFERHGGADGWASEVGNRKPASTRQGASLKAAVIERVATALHDSGVRTAQDLREVGALDPTNNNRRAAIKKLWTSVEAQSSGITWEYALTLVGVPGVKADRMVIRFVAEATGRNDLTPESTARLVREAAERMGVNPTDLDHVIWRSASGRRVQVDQTPA
ncbi:hypothetical protein GCM10007304_11680 [Rhodococcoides trifolii]|uniref:Uncharacterized protein n=1 Tax=Rhodococcoides trifolii TaxID=908250 RepID=A0A917CVC3_9NOCA|nr:hypothetical protein [Rhodococcus trifolii]GGF99479.1 hypothetical protein GCM10007304_11680 [Rhodococcus trifolii]